MSSNYLPNTNHTNPGPLTTLPLNELNNQTQNIYSPCEDCTSIYETMKYRSDYDKLYVPLYQSRLPHINTDLLDLKFAY